MRYKDKMNQEYSLFLSFGSWFEHLLVHIHSGLVIYWTTIVAHDSIKHLC